VCVPEDEDRAAAVQLAAGRAVELPQGAAVVGVAAGLAGIDEVADRTPGVPGSRTCRKTSVTSAASVIKATSLLDVLRSYSPDLPERIARGSRVDGGRVPVPHHRGRRRAAVR
jgi:hypothetical protein